MLHKRKPRVVLDSVVLVSAFITENGLAAELLDRAAEKTDLYTTEEILKDFALRVIQNELRTPSSQESIC